MKEIVNVHSSGEHQERLKSTCREEGLEEEEDDEELTGSTDDSEDRRVEKSRRRGRD